MTMIPGTNYQISGNSIQSRDGKEISQQQFLEKVQSKEIASVLTLFRVRVSENAVQNANPTIDQLIVDGAPLPRGATIMVQMRILRVRPVS